MISMVNKFENYLTDDSFEDQKFSHEYNSFGDVSSDEIASDDELDNRESIGICENEEPSISNYHLSDTHHRFNFSTGIVSSSKLNHTWNTYIVRMGKVLTEIPLCVQWCMSTPFFVRQQYDHNYGCSVVQIAKRMNVICGMFVGYMYSPEHGPIYVETIRLYIGGRIMIIDYKI